MSEEEVKNIRQIAGEMLRLVQYPETGETLVVFDPGAVPDNYVLVNVARRGTPLEAVH